ncbi:unnamed protein product [Euphydryas editha]|uniref:Uncharacterized protein n=1 Tax=Euphydryas editha TaxID=104508 RepID=A0AAU9TQ65_EUPED|nr:unnamed protein product [Euphydryas editha]
MCSSSLKCINETVPFSRRDDEDEIENEEEHLSLDENESDVNYFAVETAHVCAILHQVNLMRLVVEEYFAIRYYHKLKLDTVNSYVASKRKLFIKQIQRDGH